MRLTFGIAWRFIWRYKSQSALIILGIAVGISVLIFIGSLIKGLQESLIDVAIGRIAHITVASADEDDPYIRRYDQMILKLDQMKGEIKVASPAIAINGFAIKKAKDEPVLLKGVDLARGDSIYQIDKHLKSGAVFRDRREVVIGKALAKNLEVKVGDKLKLKTAQSGEVEVTVTGIFDLDNEMLNKGYVYMSLKTAQSLFSLNGKASTIDIQVYDVYNADKTMATIASMGRLFDLDLSNWKETNASLLSGLRSQTISTVMIQAFVLISVILGIASVLAVSVMQKSKQVGILKAMGLDDLRTSLIFVWQGAILSGIGIVLGVGLGLFLIYGFIQGTKGSATTIKISLDSVYILKVSIISFVMACASVAVPARRTKVLDPIEVIKNG